MAKGILDQNGIILLNGRETYDAIILSPMFMWELFNNIGSPKERILIRCLKLICDRIIVTFKSISCEDIELKSGMSMPFDKTIDYKSTKLIKQWLNNSEPYISDVRDTLSTGLTSDVFMDLFNGLALSILPNIQSEFKRSSAKDRQLIQNNFEAEKEEMSEILCHKSISDCCVILKSKGFSDEQAIRFLKEPTVLYNRVFCCRAVCTYRATQADLHTKIKANDNKDIDYLFLAHHVDDLISNDRFMKHTFSHLKKSHEILKTMKTGL